MSRTFRRKNPHKRDLKWVLRDYVYVRPGNWLIMHHEPDSEEYRKRLTQYHMDKYRSFKEPGPAWFRNMFTERPQRREGQRQIRAYMKGQIDDVVLNAMDKLTYWT